MAEFALSKKQRVDILAQSALSDPFLPSQRVVDMLGKFVRMDDTGETAWILAAHHPETLGFSLDRSDPFDYSPVATTLAHLVATHEVAAIPLFMHLSKERLYLADGEGVTVLEELMKHLSFAAAFTATVPHRLNDRTFIGDMTYGEYIARTFVEEFRMLICEEERASTLLQMQMIGMRSTHVKDFLHKLSAIDTQFVKSAVDYYDSMDDEVIRIYKASSGKFAEKLHFRREILASEFPELRRN